MKKICMFLVCLCSCISYAAPVLTGAGSSFAAPAMFTWTRSYLEKNHTKVNYQPVGSEAGVQQLNSGTVDFAISDGPFSDEELAKYGWMQFPLVVGAILPVVNIPGIEPGQLILDGPTLASIYNARITYWDDPSLVALNKNLTLPHQRITAIYRADGSGTTFQFTHFLEKSAPHIWTQGHGFSVDWPSGLKGLGGKGNGGVAALVKRMSGSVGYVELSYALGGRLSWTRLVNAAGHVVPVPSSDREKATTQTTAAQMFQSSMADALKGVNWKTTQGMAADLVFVKKRQAWPITTATYALLPKKQSNSVALKKFFLYVLEEGSESARALDYLALPHAVTLLIQEKWDHDGTQK